jgi:AmiR/NasT family two-component response regulator
MNDSPELELNTTVAFAAGMVAAHAQCGLREAVALMRDQATQTGQSLDEIAAAVIERRVRFIGDDGPPRLRSE